MSCAWISGVGVVSALGSDAAATVRNLFAPEAVLPRPPRRFATELALPVFEIPEPDAVTAPVGLPLKFLLHALAEALAEARLTPEDLRKLRVGVAVGTTASCQLDDLAAHARMRGGDLSDTVPLRRYVTGLPAEYLRRELGLSGPAVTVSNACSSGADAAVLAFDWLRTGRCDIVIAGGCDCVGKVAFNGFNALRVCAAEPCRPFDAGRTGLNLGDGAGVVVLETPRSALARGIACEYELAGAGKTADAFHITQPESSGAELERAVRQALDAAGIPPEEIDFVNAHGTGTRVNDRVEGATLARIFGTEVRYHSTKALTGHTLGAAGAMELVFCKLMLQARRAAASRRWERPDPEIPVPPLTAPTPISGKFALSTSLAFGGSNTALAVGPARDAVPEDPPPGPGIAAACLLPAGAPDREELAALCRKYGLRRVDRLIQMMLAAADRVAAELAGPGETALLTVTAYGPANTTDRVLDDILDFPEEEILPTGFSHSVVNAASSYLSSALNIHGPVFATAGFDDPFYEAADLARTLLAAGRCRRVLIVAGDEECLNSRAAEPLRQGVPPVTGEGAFALVLTAGPSAHGHLELVGRSEARRRVLPCGIPEGFPEAVAAAGPDAATTLARLVPPRWGK